MATWTLLGRGTHCKATAVMTPSVPSLPINSCLMSYLSSAVSDTRCTNVDMPTHPVLSFRSTLSRSSTVPSARTTSKPSTLPCRLP